MGEPPVSDGSRRSPPPSPSGTGSRASPDEDPKHDEPGSSAGFVRFGRRETGSSSAPDPQIPTIQNDVPPIPYQRPNPSRKATVGNPFSSLPTPSRRIVFFFFGIPPSLFPPFPSLLFVYGSESRWMKKIVGLVPHRSIANAPFLSFTCARTRAPCSFPFQRDLFRDRNASFFFGVHLSVGNAFLRRKTEVEVPGTIHPFVASFLFLFFFLWFFCFDRKIVLRA